MRDNLDDLPARLARDLASVRWPGPSAIRRRARRRTIRTVLAAPLAVILVVAGIGWRAWVGGDAQPAAGTPTSLFPTLTSPAATPSTTPQNPQWIPPEAMLQPEDVGAGQRVGQDFTYEPGQLSLWSFDLSDCPAYAELGITAYLDHQFMRLIHIVPADTIGFEAGDTLFVQTLRYPDPKASTVVEDIRRAVTACAQYERAGSEASTPRRPAHTEFTWTLLDEDFAGDESLLIHEGISFVADDTGDEIAEPVVTVLAVVRVNDLVTIISRYSPDALEIMTLGQRAAPRLCTASIPRC